MSSAAAPGDSPVDLVLRRARLLAPAPPDAVDVAIGAGRIVALAERVAAAGRQEIDLDGCLLLPGLVDLHLHLDKATTLAHLGAADGLGDAIARYLEYKRQLTAQDVIARGREVVERLRRHGTCALRTHVDVDAIVGLRGVEGALALREAYADGPRVQVVAFARGADDVAAPPARDLLRGALGLGCDCIGGTPNLNADPRRYVDTLLDLAAEYGIRADLHVEENTAPDVSVLEYVAEATMRLDLQGRVTASHCCSLSMVSDDVADRVIAKVRAAGIAVCTLPLTNLFLQGEGGRVPGPRGLTRVRDLWTAGVPVCCGSDNIEDPFNPYGNGDLLLAALVCGLAVRQGSEDEQARLLDSITGIPAAAMGLEGYGLRVGARADVVAFACQSQAELLARQPERVLVVQQGCIVVDRVERARPPLYNDAVGTEQRAEPSGR